MRKSLVLALVLVFAIAGATFAATPDISAEFTAKAEHNSGPVDKDATFIGQFDLTSNLKLGISFGPEGDGWDATVNIAGLTDIEKAGLGFYRINVNDDTFSATVWGKQSSSASIGHKQDPFVFVRASGNNTSANPAVRVTSDLAGVNLTGQIPSAGKSVYFFGDTDVDAFKLGAGLEHTFKDGATDASNRYVLYGGTKLDIVSVDAAFAADTKQNDKNSGYGVKAAADVTEQLNVSASYTKVEDNFGGLIANASPEKGTTYKVGATFTEGLLQVKGDYAANTANSSGAKAVATTTVGVTYRGSEENVAFGDLFKPAEYYKNVAPAFSVSYTMDQKANQPASTITLNATAPVVADQIWVKGSLSMKSNADRAGQQTFNASGDILAAWDEFDLPDNVRRKEKQPTGLPSYKAEAETKVGLDAYVKVNDKLTLEPNVGVTNWKNYSASAQYEVLDADGNVASEPVVLRIPAQDASMTSFGVKATYKVGENADITFSVSQAKYDRENADALTERTTSIGLKVKF